MFPAIWDFCNKTSWDILELKVMLSCIKYSCELNFQFSKGGNVRKTLEILVFHQFQNHKGLSAKLVSFLPIMQTE